MQKQFLDNTGLAELLEELGQYLKEIKADKTELPLIVHMDDTLQTCDTSIADIYTAYSVGRVVQMKIAGLSVSLSLVSSSSSSTAFAVTDKGTSLIVSGTNESGSDVWTLDSFTAQEKLTFDSTPTAGSNNPVTSGGVKTALDRKQDALVSGTNIKTINNTSLLGDGNISIEPNEIASITTSESSASGGNNTVTINTTNGTTTTFNVKNGVDGVSLGEVALMQITGDSEESVMSQKAVTEYGRKVTAEDLAGTSNWIREKLTEEGWEFGRVLNNNGTVGGVSNWMCVSPMFPCSTNHSFLFQPKKTNNSGNCMLAFYNGSDAFKGSTTVAVIDGTQTYTPTDSTITQLRFSCNMNDLSNVFVKDTTTEEYIFKGDEDIKNLIADSENVVSYSVLEDSIIKQTTGESSISLMSQRAITDAIARQNGFEASEGMATINDNNVYTKLTQRQVERLNSGEVATFHILAKPIKSHPSGMFGASFFVSRDSLGYSIYQNAGNIIVNGITIATYNTIGMFPVSRYFVCDRVNGVVSLYTGTKLLAKVQNDSFKKDKFIGDDGIFGFNSGYYKAVLYEMKIFDFDAFSLSYNDAIFNYNLRDAEVATMNPDSVKNAFNLFDTTVYTKNKPTVATNNAQYSRTTDSEGYSTISVSPTATATCMLQQNPHYFDTSRGNVYNYGQNMVKEIIFDLEVISGNINLATNTTGDVLEIKKVIDESGNIIDDASNCGIGVYHIHIITSNPNTGIIKSAGVSCVFRLLSASIKMLCCVAHLSFNKWYNGEIYDDEADTYYHLYSDSSLSKEPTNIALSPEPARRNGTLKLTYPQFIGQIAITSSGIFMGNKDYVWKQINNS